MISTGEDYHKIYDEAAARRYSLAKDRDSLTNRAEARLVRRAMRRVPLGETVLDIPCGTGRVTVLWARAGYPVTAADVSPAMVAIARQSFQAEGLPVPVLVEDLEGTSFPDRSHDTVFCFRLFHHFPDDAIRTRVARELCRIARRRVLVSYLDARSVTSLRRRLLRTAGAKEHRHPQRPPAMRQLFERCGFRVTADLARVPWVHSLRLLVAERG